VRSLISLIVMALIMMPAAAAHEAKDYTILLTSDGTTPDSVPEGTLVTTDRLFFMMVDSREDARHQIMLDADNDGIYNGSDDLSSPWLTYSCELDEEGNKTDSDCMVTYTLILGPENGLLPGNVSLLIKTYEKGNSTNYTFTASFAEDVHVEPMNPQPSGDPQSEVEQNDDSNLDSMFSRLALAGILVGGTTGILSIMALIRDKSELD